MVYYSLSGYNSDMFLIDILSWWYGGGWLNRFRAIRNGFVSWADYFSIGLMVSTLFAPFRQISTETVVAGPIEVRVRAFFDKLLSRVIGAIVRTFMIVFGLTAMFLQILFGIFVLVFWLVIPLLPVIGLVMMLIGWTP